MTRIVLFLSLVLLAGCCRKTEVQIVRITNAAPTTRVVFEAEPQWCNENENPAAYKIVTDGVVFKVRYATGTIGCVEYETEQEARSAALKLAKFWQEECPKHRKRIWKEVECK